MASHGWRMLTMGVVVVVLFTVEIAFGVLPPIPGTTAAFRRLVESPTFWVAFVGNIVSAILVVAVVTETGDDSEVPPGHDGS